MLLGNIRAVGYTQRLIMAFIAKQSL